MEYHDEKNSGIGAKVTDKTVSFELNTDLSLPDYLGEVSRLLWVRPSVSAPTRFLTGESAEFSGRVCYGALYAGADGRLYTAETEDTYSFSVPTSAPRADMLSVHVYPDVMVGRVAAPRKLSLRSKMHAHVCAYDEKSIDTVLPREFEEDVCRLGGVIECGRILHAEGESMELFGEVEASGLSLLMPRAEVFLPEVSVRSGVVACRGEVIVTLLCHQADEGNGEGGEPYLPRPISHRLPFALEIPLEGACSDCEARASATVEEIRVAENEGKLSVAVRLLPVATVACREPVAYTKDLFLPGHDTECHRREEGFFLPSICGNKNFSVSGTFPYAEIGLPEGATVIDAMAEAEVKEKNTDGKSTVLSGEIHCHVLFMGGGEFGTSDVILPYRVTQEGTFEELSAVATVPVLSVRAERGGLRVDAELLLSLLGLTFGKVTPVSDAVFEARESDPEADLLLCYPAQGESLWDVARRTAVPPRRIAEANGMNADDMEAESSLSGVPFLMIPDVK
ncbi:MAG: LysM peptidoglycan-binding domain-containing protein [Clostridia bacterium]|nr:LysM peptidoglycan-binding domain-containing protein [Clostridia bacterium]